MRTLAATAALIALATTPVRPQIFTARVDTVRLDVLVTERNRPLTGLTRSDFSVLDNGIEQSIDFATFENIPLDVVLALDLSGSVSAERLGQLQAATRLVVDRLTSEDSAAVITFTQYVTVAAALTKDRARVRSALDSPRLGIDTALIDASFSAMLVGAKGAGRPLVLVFSDGVDTASWLQPDLVLDTAKRSEAVVFGVSTGRVGRRSFLSAIADQTSGEVLNIDSTRDLGAAFVKILDEFRQRYLISYTPQGISRNGWHQVQVSVKNRRATVKSRPGYLAGS